MKKTRNWLAALTLVGLLAFQAVPAFADVVITCKNIQTGPNAVSMTVSYGPVFKSDNPTLRANVTLSLVNADGSRTGVAIFSLGLDPADPTHKTLEVNAHNLWFGRTLELRIKPGATVQSTQPTEPPQILQPTQRLP